MMSIEEAGRKFAHPLVAAHLRDVLGRQDGELAAIVDSKNICWQRCTAAGLVRQKIGDDPAQAKVISGFIDLILECDEVRRQRGA